jgi:1,4-dihydroxy-2-naphthoate octaprenyltransferase
MSINNLRDIESDRLTKKRTVAIFLGAKKARVLTLILVITPGVISLYFVFVSSWWFIFPVFSVITFRDFKVIAFKEIDNKLNKTLAKCGQYMFIHSLAIVIATVLVNLL